MIKKTGLKEDEIIVILHNHTVQTDLDLSAVNSKSQVSSDIDVNKQYYINIISHALISMTGNTYELSLFGVMLVISLIRYHYMEIDKDRLHKDMKPNEYCDLIAKNYTEKLRLIFGKWNFLQEQLGFLLYDSFDFLIYKKSGF